MANDWSELGVTPNSDNEVETTCINCGGPAVLWRGGEGELKAHCIKCKKLDAEAVVDALRAAFKARQSTRDSQPKPTSKVFASKPLVPAPALPAARSDDDLLRKAPPNSDEAEKSVLGAILIDNELMATVAGMPAEAFYQERHRILFRAFADLRSTATTIDPVTVGELLKKNEQLEWVGGYGYLAELATFVPAPSAIKHYAQIVTDMAYKRTVAERATELARHAYNGVSADALAGEAQKLFTFNEPSGQLPALITREIEVVSGKDFHRRQIEAPAQQWVVQKLLARKEISLWSGKVEAGKTTLLRTLCMSIMRGEDFLGRWCSQGKILYVMLDADGERLTHTEFLGLGWEPNSDPLDLLVDPVMALRPNSFEQFHKKLLEIRPSMVVIDPLGRFKKIGDFLGYETTYAMAEFSELAKQTDCHIALLHHIPRGRGDNDDAATAGFGSIAIAGGCNARFVVVKKPGGIHVLRTSQGKGGGFEPFEGDQVLAIDEQTHRITLKGAYDWKEQADAIRPAVRKAVEEAGDWITTHELAREIHVQRSIAGAAAKSLYQAGEIAHFQAGSSGKFYWGKLGLQSPLELKSKKKTDV